MMLVTPHPLIIGFGERMKMIDKIYIPTFRRVNDQTTFDNLPDEYKEKVVMVVQEQERDAVIALKKIKAKIDAKSN